MKYRFYTNGTNTVVCKSTFAKRVVAGVAKCNPKDQFSLEFGKQLAQARCDYKIAKKRLKYAKEQRAISNKIMIAAQQRHSEMQKYMENAIKELNDTKAKMEGLL
jgi:hypothetical protein